MTESNERIATLESQMTYVMGVLSKREDYQNSVLVKLTQIEMKQDQALLYQKTCDAERTAHGNRLQAVENALARNQTVFATLLRVGGGLGGLLALGLSLARVLGHP